MALRFAPICSFPQTGPRSGSCHILPWSAHVQDLGKLKEETLGMLMDNMKGGESHVAVVIDMEIQVWEKFCHASGLATAKVNIHDS